jgi:hypothetical protein
MVIALTKLLNQLHIVKEASLVPSLFRRISLFAVTQPYVVNAHQARTFPLVWIARVYIELLNHTDSGIYIEAS